MNESYIGTLISIKQFFDNEAHDIKMNDNVIATLEKGRYYYIPKYQREIRWTVKNMYELIRDIDTGKNFLGNIILRKEEDDSNIFKYEVIDGQQRITCLLMIIDFIQYVHKDKNSLTKLDSCLLKIENFIAFEKFRSIHYSENDIQEKEIETDYFNQIPRYVVLWKSLSENEVLKTVKGRRNFLEKLEDCAFNVIIINSDKKGLPIEYFISVNQKGVRLDTEDIFKGFLFQYNADIVSSSWLSIKRKCIHINTHNMKRGTKKECFPLLLLLEQYFYCTLYENNSLLPLSFNKDFLLSKNFEYDGERYEKETHLLSVLENIDREDEKTIQTDLESIEKLATIIESILCNSFPEAEFVKLINPHLQETSNKISQNGIKFMANILLRILSCSDNVPKILGVKYILDILMNPDIKDCDNPDRFREIKEKYYSIFVLDALATMFTMVVGKKSRENLYPSVRGENWLESVNSLLAAYILRDNSKISQKLNMSYKFFVDMDEEENTRRDQFYSKGLAAVYNYLQCKKNNNGYEFSCGKRHQKVCDFFIDADAYTLEHFLMNDSKGYLLKLEKTEKFSYPQRMLKYIGSIYNFIYIHKKVNGDVLGNNVLPAKLEILNKKGSAYDALEQKDKEKIDDYPIECSFSRDVITLLLEENDEHQHKIFPKYWSAYRDSLEQNNNEPLEQYYNDCFEEEYYSFIEKINEMFLMKLRNLVK